LKIEIKEGEEDKDRNRESERTSAVFHERSMHYLCEI
jgi:hypothetical protein